MEVVILVIETRLGELEGEDTIHVHMKLIYLSLALFFVC